MESRARTERLLLPDLVLLQRIMRADPGQARQLPANPLPARQLRLSKQPAERARQPAVPVQEAQLPEGDGRKAAPAVKIIPLGGLHEIGKNMTALEYEDEIIIVDCGLSFPDDDMFGIDKVIPDFSYLEKNSKKIKGLIITHGHEDHIGGVPYLLKVINVPIYGTRFPLGLIENKLKEHGMKARMHTVKAGQTFKLGKHFSVEALRITHSIADSICLSITTPAGRILPHGRFQDRLYAGGWRPDRLRQTGADRIGRSASDDGGQHQRAASGIYGIGACSRQDAGEYFPRLQ